MALHDPPELVICDLLMPDIDGYEVVDQLWANPTTQDAMILILTEQDLSASDRERLSGKVADVLGKDGDPRPALARWLQRAAAASQGRSPGGHGGLTAPRATGAQRVSERIAMRRRAASKPSPAWQRAPTIIRLWWIGTR